MRANCNYIFEHFFLLKGIMNFFSIYGMQQYYVTSCYLPSHVKCQAIIMIFQHFKRLCHLTQDVNSPSNTHKQFLFVFLGAYMGRLFGQHACLEQSQMKSIIFLLISEKDPWIVQLSISLAISIQRSYSGFFTYLFILDKA